MRSGRVADGQNGDCRGSGPQPLVHVVDIVLDEEIVRGDIGYDLRRLFGAVEEEAGDV